MRGKAGHPSACTVAVGAGVESVEADRQTDLDGAERVDWFGSGCVEPIGERITGAHRRGEDGSACSHGGTAMIIAFTLSCIPTAQARARHGVVNGHSMTYKSGPQRAAEQTLDALLNAIIAGSTGEKA